LNDKTKCTEGKQHAIHLEDSTHLKFTKVYYLFNNDVCL